MLSWTKRCRNTLQCQHICNRRAEYSATNDKWPAEAGHWKLDWKRKVFSSWLCDQATSTSWTDWQLRSAMYPAREAFSCSFPPQRSVFCQPQGVGHRNSRVSADLLSPGGRRSASGTPPVGTWPDTVLCFATGPKDRNLLVHHQQAWQYDQTVRDVVCERWKKLPTDQRDAELRCWVCSRAIGCGGSSAADISCGTTLQCIAR